jgi:hypothetical protein
MAGPKILRKGVIKQQVRLSQRDCAEKGAGTNDLVNDTAVKLGEKRKKNGSKKINIEFLRGRIKMTEMTATARLRVVEKRAINWGERNQATRWVALDRDVTVRRRKIRGAVEELESTERWKVD